MDTENLQRIVNEYFKDVNSNIIIDLVNIFTYGGNGSIEANNLLLKFIEENGLTEAYDNVKKDETGESRYFTKASMSERSVIYDLRICFLTLSFNVLKQNRNKLNISVTKSQFKLLKDTALNCYNSLNRNESYFYGREEDAKVVDKINKIKYE